MKKIFFILLFVFCISCTEEHTFAEIQIQTTNVDFIEIKNPIDDIVLWNSKTDTIYANDKDVFLFSKEIKQPEFVTIKIGKTRLQSILMPGKQVKINKIDSAYVFEGTNKAGMELLNDFKRPFFDMNESNLYRNDTTSIQVKQKIEALKQPELAKIQELLDANKIELEFSKILRKEVDYFYAQRTAQIVSVRQYYNNGINDDLLTLFDETVATYPLQTQYKSRSWNMYAETVLKEKALYDVLAKGVITNDTIQRYYLEDKLHPYNYDLIKTYEDMEITEKVAADYIINSTKQNKFEKSLITVYEQFQKDFPTSNYTKYLTADIEKIKQYHVKISGEMPADVLFYEDETVASLKDLMKELKGDKYYVDLWATWCSPCKKEFKHNDALNALLKEKGYEKLYISLDKPAQRKKWKQDIKYFDLSGLHLLASEAFFIDFEKNHSTQQGYVSIPQYLIIDENGTLITNNAPRPSSLEALRKILE